MAGAIPGASRVDEVARKLMRKLKRSRIWYGDPDLINDVSLAAGRKQGHPLNKSAAVMRAVARSPLFELSGSITHLGRSYRVYQLRRRPS